MSTLRATNIADTSGGNSSTTAQIASGRSKAWCNFNGTGVVSIKKSFGVTSVVDNGTGTYDVNWSTAFADGEYCVVTGQTDASNGSNRVNEYLNTINVSYVRIYGLPYTAATFGDIDRVYVATYS